LIHTATTGGAARSEARTRAAGQAQRGRLI
jgi:hypothetical protein